MWKTIFRGLNQEKRENLRDKEREKTSNYPMCTVQKPASQGTMMAGYFLFPFIHASKKAYLKKRNENENPTFEREFLILRERERDVVRENYKIIQTFYQNPNQFIKERM